MDRQRHREPEDRAAPDLALDADLAVHEIDKPRADGKAEAGAFMAAGRGRVDLRELLEHALQLVRRDTDAGIFDADLQMHDAVRDLAGDIDQDMTLFGELDGIAQQVGDDLAETPGIADDEGRQARIDAHDQFQVLFGDPCRNQSGNVLDGFGQPEWCRIKG